MKKSAKPAHSGETTGTEDADDEVAGGVDEGTDVGWKTSSVRAYPGVGVAPNERVARREAAVASTEDEAFS